MKLLTYLLVSLCCTMVFGDDRFSTSLTQDGFIQEAKQIIGDLEQTPVENTTVFKRVIIDITGDIVKKRVQKIMYYDDTASIEQYGTAQVYFDQSNTSVVIHVAASLKRDGSVTMIDPKTIQLNEQDSYNTFNDGKIANLPIPGLTKNNFTVIDYFITEDISLNQGGYLDLLWAENHFPMLNIDLQIKWRGIELSSKNTHPLLQCEQSTQSIRCVGQKIPKADFSGSDYWQDTLRGLFIVKQANWDNVVGDILDLYNKAFLESSEVDQLYTELTKDTTSQEEIINSIFRFVSEDIRYVSLSTAGHTHQPHSNNSVINNRFGDCKDKTALLHALLKKTGIDATPTLVATERAKPEKLPLPSAGYFNHIVLCFTLNGTQYCLDPTDRTTHWSHTSGWIQSKVSLPLKPNAMPQSIEKDQYLWQMDIETLITFTKEGGSSETQTRTFYGEYASYMRQRLEYSSHEDQLEQLAKQYRRAVADIDDLEADILTPIDGDRKTFKVSTAANFDPYLTTTGDVAFSEKEYWIVEELNSLTITEDSNEKKIYGLKHSSLKKIDFSAGWKITKATPELELNHRFGRLKRESKIENGVMTVNTLIEIPTQTILPSEIDEFNLFIEKLSSSSIIRLEGMAL